MRYRKSPNIPRRNLVVITGATDGLGRELARKFAQKNWHVAGCGRSIEKIKGLRKELGDTHFFHPVDVTNYSEVMKWNKAVNEYFKKTPTLLINNAGVINKKSNLWEISDSDFDQLIKINISGVYHVIKAFVPAMVKENKGLIINMSSIWGRHGEAGFAPYCASKFAIEGLTQSLALELNKTKLAAIALDPGGAIKTPMLQNQLPEYANDAPNPNEWADKAVPFILELLAKGSEINGIQSLTCPLFNPKPK